MTVAEAIAIIREGQAEASRRMNTFAAMMISAKDRAMMERMEAATEVLIEAVSKDSSENEKS